MAVCIKPGTELAFEREIEFDLPWLTRRLGSQVARFRRVNEDRTFGHHDALELTSGKVVLLTRLLVGQRATVLQLPVVERETERHPRNGSTHVSVTQLVGLTADHHRKKNAARDHVSAPSAPAGASLSPHAAPYRLDEASRLDGFPRTSAMYTSMWGRYTKRRK